MTRQLAPVYFKLMHLTPERLRVLKPVTVLDIYTNNTESFHPNGLFSIEIFGRVGSEDRDKRFSFIDLKTDIFHPLYYKELVRLKRLYGEIITGTSYAIFDDKEKDFIPANEITGKTGYSFFLENWKKVVFKDTGSQIRRERINFLTKYRDVSTTQYILVLPAGLRDLEIGSDGRTQEGEVNAFYRKLIGISNSIITKGLRDQELLNTARCAAQGAFNNIYAYFNRLISGKHGFIMGLWAARNIEHGTRSVITGVSASNAALGNPSNIGTNSTVVGIFQLMKAIQPVVIHALLTGYISQVFVENSTLAHLVDKKTFKRSNIQLDSLTIDKWMTSPGLAKQIDYFEDRSLRAKPIIIKDHYLGLVYKDDKYFKLFGDIDELPDGFDKANVKPITYIELFYLSYFDKWNSTPGFVTRYPITGTGSIYPSRAYLKTTETTYDLEELGEDWQPTGRRAISYPNLINPTYVDSIGTAQSRIGGLGADFDGDTASFNAVYTKDAVKEINDYLNSPAAYLSSKNGLVNSPTIDPVKRVIKNMTGDPE